MSGLERQERIVLLCSRASLWLEPVGKVRCTFIHGPNSDSMRNRIRSAFVQRPTAAHLLQELRIGRFGQGLGDLGQAKHILAIEFGRVDGFTILAWVGYLAAGSLHIVADGALPCLVSRRRHLLGLRVLLFCYGLGDSRVTRVEK